MNTNRSDLPSARGGVVSRDRSDRVRTEVTGPDRAKFLHNLTTQDVKRLPVGEGREAFVTSPQGKTLGHVTILAEAERFLVRCDREGWQPVLPHLTRYGVFDEVTLTDVSERTFELHVAGPMCEQALRSTGADLPAAGPLRLADSVVGGVGVLLVRESLLGAAGFTLIGDRSGRDAVIAALRAGTEPRPFTMLDDAAFEPLRIAAGTPICGRDVTHDNLPQEVARDALAINFVKGCYLGQETVARIDALGHVNRLLRGLRLPEGALPASGAAVLAEGKSIGTITSAAAAPDLACVVALGYIRSSHIKAGTRVQVALGEPGGTTAEGVVCDLPIRVETPGT